MSWCSTPLAAVDVGGCNLPVPFARLDLLQQDVEVAGIGAGVEHDEIVERAQQRLARAAKPPARLVRSRADHELFDHCYRHRDRLLEQPNAKQIEAAVARPTKASDGIDAAGRAHGELEHI